MHRKSNCLPKRKWWAGGFLHSYVTKFIRESIIRTNLVRGIPFSFINAKPKLLVQEINFIGLTQAFLFDPLLNNSPNGRFDAFRQLEMIMILILHVLPYLDWFTIIDSGLVSFSRCWCKILNAVSFVIQSLVFKMMQKIIFFSEKRYVVAPQIILLTVSQLWEMTRNSKIVSFPSFGQLKAQFLLSSGFFIF